MLKYSLLILTWALSLQVAFSQNCKNLVGSWVNEIGSVLVIDSLLPKTGKIVGNYKSSTGVDGRVFPLQGWINSTNKVEGKHIVKAISFTVRWGEYGSITSWTGYCSNDSLGCYIKTIWNLVRPKTDLEFEHIITNSSTFRPLVE